MPARRFMMLVKESSYGVPKSSPVLGVDKFYLRMGDGTDIQDDPIIQETPFGGGRTTAACAWSDQRTHEGTINTLLYQGQAEFFLKWWLQNINTGRTTPWATTDPDQKSPPGDLASVSIYDAIQNLDGSYTRTAHRGCKVDSGTLNIASDGESRAVQISLQVRGGDIVTVNDTEFPAPTASSYPCGPYVFSDLGGNLEIEEERPFFDNFAFAASNGLVTRYWSGAQTPYVVNTYGRNSTLSVWLPRKTTPDDFGRFNGVANMSGSFTLDDGVKWVKVDMGANNHWQSLAKQLPNGDMYGWNGVLKNKWDNTADADIVVTSGDSEEP